MKMGLIEDIEARRPRVVAFVGLAKNCGKTTALNHVAAGYRAAGVRLGLTSAGRDGEATDAVTRQSKPRVPVWPGVLLATARESLAEATAPWRLVEQTGLPTAMGPLAIVEATGEGIAELAGPVTLAQCRPVLDGLLRAGAGRVLLDGALDRLAVAAPAVSDAVVLAAGAVLGPTAADVAAKVRGLATGGQP